MGPILFLLYTADVPQLMKTHQLNSHAYAEYTQIYGFCQPSDVYALQEHISVCIDAVISWMMTNRLQINPAKTKVLWCSSARRQHQIPSDSVRVGNTSVLPESVVRDLGVYPDADLSMRAHITATVRTCLAALRQIRSVRRSLTPDALLTLLCTLVITKLDFYCSTLAGVSGTLLQKLQSVLNATARLVYSTLQRDRNTQLTPLLLQLHWLKDPERIKFRLCVLVHRCLHNKLCGRPPQYAPASYVTLTFHLLTLKVVSESRVTWATSLPIIVFLLPRPLCCRFRPDVRDRQTDRRQTRIIA